MQLPVFSFLFFLYFLFVQISAQTNKFKFL
jgi:hypothetical protein